MSQPRYFVALARGLLGLVLVTLLSACSKPDGRRILGHWRAEQMQLQGLRLPMGPDFVVREDELRSTNGEIRIPVSSITETGGKITLNVPFGLGLAFEIEGADRISFEIPLIGEKVYYRRVSDESLIVASPPPVSIPVTPLPSKIGPTSAPSTTPILAQQAVPKIEISVESASLPLSSAQKKDGESLAYYNQSIFYMRQGNSDAAVRSLRDAFEYGFRDFERLDASPDLMALKRDPRYVALISRYR